MLDVFKLVTSKQLVLSCLSNKLFKNFTFKFRNYSYLYVYDMICILYTHTIIVMFVID